MEKAMLGQQDTFDYGVCCMVCGVNCLGAFFVGWGELGDVVFTFQLADKARKNFNIRQNIIHDACCSCCCGPCMRMQVWRELNERGLYPGTTCAGNLKHDKRVSRYGNKPNHLSAPQTE